MPHLQSLEHHSRLPGSTDSVVPEQLSHRPAELGEVGRQLPGPSASVLHGAEGPGDATQLGKPGGGGGNSGG